jgi:hypothetical protein
MEVDPDEVLRAIGRVDGPGSSEYVEDGDHGGLKNEFVFDLRSCSGDGGGSMAGVEKKALVFGLR